MKNQNSRDRAEELSIQFEETGGWQYQTICEKISDSIEELMQFAKETGIESKPILAQLVHVEVEKYIDEILLTIFDEYCVAYEDKGAVHTAVYEDRDDATNAYDNCKSAQFYRESSGKKYPIHQKIGGCYCDTKTWVAYERFLTRCDLRTK